MLIDFKMLLYSSIFLFPGHRVIQIVPIGILIFSSKALVEIQPVENSFIQKSPGGEKKSRTIKIGSNKNRFLIVSLNTNPQFFVSSDFGRAPWDAPCLKNACLEIAL